MLRTMLRILMSACLCVCLLACSKLSQENFDQVKPNMTMKEVTAILGEPTSAESINIAGISGTSAVWKNENVEIDIQFLNDKVAVKSFNKTPATHPDRQSDEKNGP